MSDDLLKKFNDFLKKEKYEKYFIFVFEKNVKKNKNIKKNKIERMKEDIINKRNIKQIKDFISSLAINRNHYPNPKKTNIESTLNIIYWLLYLIKSRKSNIDVNIYIDACISFYRILNDNFELFNHINNDNLQRLLYKFEKMTHEKCEDMYNIILNENFQITLNSFYDLHKPLSISLYREQEEVIDVITSAVENNQKKLIFYWVPPANGKTLISSLVTKMLSEKKQKKILLYICYNDIV